MRKSLWQLGSLLVVAAMLLAACGSATGTPAEPAAPAEQPTAAPQEPAAKEVLNVWSFTNEIRTMAVAFEGRNPNVDVVYTIIPMTNGEYQTKLKAALGTADAPDVVALEAAFVKEWVEADFLADLNDLLPLTEELKTYPSVVQVGTNEGVTKGYSYQATPGAFFYRRSIATECLGTDDPAAVQAMVADLDKFLEPPPRSRHAAMETTSPSEPPQNCSTPSWRTAPSRGSSMTHWSSIRRSRSTWRSPSSCGMRDTNRRRRSGPRAGSPA